MFVVEHRRHTMRTKPGQHLSQAGVELARRVGETMGSFDLVVTSHVPRAFETAIAMGHAVDEQLEALGNFWPELEAELGSWDAGYARFREVATARPDGAVARFAASMAAIHDAIVGRLPSSGRALVVSHGGFPEATVVGCLPSFDCSSWGPGCDYCEGVRLHHDGRNWIDAELLRVA